MSNPLGGLIELLAICFIGWLMLHLHPWVRAIVYSAVLVGLGYWLLMG